MTDPTADRLAEGLLALNVGAIRVAAEGLARLPEGYRHQIQAAVDDGLAELTLQIDLPSGKVRLMADGQLWVSPQCLLAVDPSEPTPQPTLNG